MTTHLRLNCYMGYDEHPQQTMKRLGITYQHATPQSMGDQWWFWNCENVPNPLPEHFSILKCEDPFEMVGWGLSKENAQKIKDYVSQMRTKRFECLPYISKDTIGEIQVSIELTDEEILSLKLMSKEEYETFIRSKANVQITDFDVEYEVMPIDEWDVSDK